MIITTKAKIRTDKRLERERKRSSVPAFYGVSVANALKL